MKLYDAVSAVVLMFCHICECVYMLQYLRTEKKKEMSRLFILKWYSKWKDLFFLFTETAGSIDNILPAIDNSDFVYIKENISSKFCSLYHETCFFELSVHSVKNKATKIQTLA